IPELIQRELWNYRDSLECIQVISEEPFIPWEIVHLKEPKVGGRNSPLGGESLFLAEKGLVRWLHNQGAPAKRISIRGRKALFVIPTSPVPYDLPAAVEERAILCSIWDAQELQDADAISVIKRLGRGSDIGLFHFSGHGSMEPGDASTAKIMLQG